MRVFDHELLVRRGESFTIDKIIQNQDGSPYIISSQLRNPHFLITVSSTLYPTAESYVYHAWLPLNNFPRFYTTVPVNLGDFTKANGGKAYPNGFDSGTGLPSAYYVDGNIDTYSDPHDALFYVEDDDGTRTYKWYNGSNWVDYECRIVYTFLREYTKDWVEGSYYYSIELVSGNLAESGDKPLIIDSSFPILVPTKLSVLSDLKGGAM